MSIIFLLAPVKTRFPAKFSINNNSLFDIEAKADARSTANATATAQVTITDIKIAGLWNQALLDTGNGEDKVIGEADVQNFRFVAAASAYSETSASEVSAQSKASSTFSDPLITTIAGIWNQGGTIRTGNGDDRVEGRVAQAVELSIDQGCEASAEAVGNNTSTETIASTGDSQIKSYGIYSGTINTENGNDTVIAKSNAIIAGSNITSDFGGGVNVNLGNGDDLLEGIGDAVVDGGSGFDRVKFDFSYSDFTGAGGIVTKVPNLNQVTFMLPNPSMTVKNVEQFMFGLETFSYVKWPPKTGQGNKL